jgi:hypothetical protein
MNVNERVARYMAATPSAVSGNHGSPQTFKVACDLVNGWALPPLCALTWLRIYNERCQPRWTLDELQHKIDDAVNADHGKPRGHLLGVNGGCPRHELRPSAFVRVAPKFDREAFRRFLADHARHVDAEWLIERSPIDPASQTPANFLGALFETGERILIFDAVDTAGSAIAALVCKSEARDAERGSWDRFLKGARCGIWFLSNPIDGVWRPNRAEKWSLRSEGNVTAWRYLVVESDRDDITKGEWLTFLAQLRLPIASIVETGGRLPHALIRVDAKTKAEWDHIKDKLAPLLIRGGADPGSLSAVRLTRLPGCERLGRHDAHGVYQPFADGPHLQRLLYLDPQPTCVPISARWSAKSPERI